MVLVENKDSDKNLILHGIKLAVSFRKELCFLVITSNHNELKSQLTRSILEGYKKIVTHDIPLLRVSSVILSGKPGQHVIPLVDEHEAILVVVRSALFDRWSGAVKQSPVPYLFVNGNSALIPDYKKIVLPIDLRKESKDAVLWASWFARFNNSGINAVVANDKDKENQRNVKKNILFLKKLFVKFNLGLKVFKGTKGSLKIQFEALELAHTSRADLIIILGSSYISFIDILIGLPEKKIIRAAGELPVLIINPRKDMYIMCD